MKNSFEKFEVLPEVKKFKHYNLRMQKIKSMEHQFIICT